MSTASNLFKHSQDVLYVVANQVIFYEGQTRDYMYVVVEGEVDLLDAGGLVETVTAGGIFGEMALITRGKRSATAIARTDAKLMALDEQRFTFMVQHNPNFAQSMMQILAQQVMHDRALQPQA